MQGPGVDKNKLQQCTAMARINCTFRFDECQIAKYWKYIFILYKQGTPNVNVGFLVYHIFFQKPMNAIFCNLIMIWALTLNFSFSKVDEWTTLFFFAYDEVAWLCRLLTIWSNYRPKMTDCLPYNKEGFGAGVLLLLVYVACLLDLACFCTVG